MTKFKQLESKNKIIFKKSYFAAVRKGEKERKKESERECERERVREIEWVCEREYIYLE